MIEVGSVTLAEALYMATLQTMMPARLSTNNDRGTRGRAGWAKSERSGAARQPADAREIAWACRALPTANEVVVLLTPQSHHGDDDTDCEDRNTDDDAEDRKHFLRRFVECTPNTQAEA